MKCTNCGFENTEQAIFCEGCGERIKKVTYCKFCGNPLTGLEVYCARCGRDKDGNEKKALEQLKKAIEKMPEIKPEYKETIKENSQKLDLKRGKILTLVSELFLSIFLFVDWIKIEAVENLQELAAYFFDYGYSVETEFSPISFFSKVIKLNDLMDSSGLFAICIVFLLGAASIIIAFGSSAYFLLSKKKEWVLPFQIGCAIDAAFSALIIIGKIYLNSELSEMVDDVFSGFISLTILPYFCLIASIFLLAKGIAIFQEMDRRERNEVQ